MKEKTFASWTRMLLIFLLAMPGFSNLKLQAQDDALQLVNEMLATWEVLSNNIQISDLKSSMSADSVRSAAGNVTAFGQTTTLEVAFKGKKEVRRLMISFTKGVDLSTDLFRQIVGKDMNKVLPAGLGAKIGMKHFEVDFSDRKEVEHLKVIMTMGTWAPFGESQAVKLSEMEGTFGIKEPKSRTPFIELGLKGFMFLPEDLAKNIGIGATKLSVVGYINTVTQKLALGYELNSRELPLVPDRSLVMTGSRLQFYFENGKPGLSLGGQIEIRPSGQVPMPLNGELSIDITGTIYGEGWMDQEAYWVNPFGLSDKVYITKAGLGFGINFATTPIPTPILAIEGGISIKDSENAPPRFSGSVTLGVDTGNPTRNMIDAEVGPLNLSDFVAAFSKGNIPATFQNTLKSIGFEKLHFTLVPPGPGVNLFGIDYEPGLYAEGIFKIDKLKGAMFVDVKESGIEAFGGLSPITLDGFSLTGTQAGTGPFAYIMVRPADQQFAMALNGKLKVMGLETDADVYMSDAGFNATVRGNIMGGFSAELDVAGTDLIKGGSIYVKASMSDQDNLVQKISRDASARIGELAKQTQADYDRYTAEIERLRPLLDAKARQLKAKQEEVRKDYVRLCGLMDQRRNQEALKKAKEQEVAAKRTEVRNLETTINNGRYRRATALNSTTCPSGSRQIGDYCYTCPSGFSWNGPLTPTNNAKACVKTSYAKAVRKGSWTVFSPCPSGQIGDAGGGCYSCPSGFSPTPGVININASNRCQKIEYRSAVQGQSVKCTGRSFADLGRCWECPQGYERKFSTYRVDSDKACEPISITQQLANLDAKKRELVLLEADLNLLVKGLGTMAADLSGVASDVCNKAKDTDAINLDGRVAPIFAEWSALSLSVNEYKNLVTEMGKASVGALRASAWLVANAGEALGIVDIDKASFEGCLSAVKGGTISLAIVGKFAGADISGSFDLNLMSPADGIKQLADMLLATNSPKGLKSNGTCTRPNVPRPNLDGSRIAELLQIVNGGTRLKQRPQTIDRPDWAGERRTDE